MDWETGRKWATGAPKIDIDPGEISLMNAGACGAFVHGLEDEFMGEYRLWFPHSLSLTHITFCVQLRQYFACRVPSPFHVVRHDYDLY